MSSNMPLQEQIQGEMRGAIKSGDIKKKDVLRYLIGEFSRYTEDDQPVGKQLTDDQVRIVIKRLIKAENSLSTKDQSFIDILNAYLPATLTPEEIRRYIKQVMPEETFAKPGPIIGMIKKQLGDTAAGNDISAVVKEMAKEWSTAHNAAQSE